MSELLAHEARTRLLARALERRAPDPGQPFPCPYLPGRTARNLTLAPSPLRPGVYHSLMDLNFRRLGPVFYRPACPGCGACRALRIPVATFRPSRAQRRCRARNRDVGVTVGAPRSTPEKHRLYQRYLGARHDGQMDGSLVELRGFLYSSGVDTIEIVYRVADRLLAVAIADVEPLAMSAVYCFFDPEQERRSPGVFNVLWMLEECRRRGLPHLYLGFFVRDSPKMSYKAGFGPCELLGADGRWAPYDPSLP